MKSKFTILTLFVLLPFLSGCGDMFSSDDDKNGTVTITPSTVTLALGETQQFNADQEWGVTWSLEGVTGSSNINDKGLLTIGTDETATTITVRAKKSYYNDGTAKVTVASPGQTPSGLKVTKPSPNSIQLSWAPMSGVTQYTVQRSTTGKDFGTIGNTSGNSYTDKAVTAGASYYYRIQSNGVNSQIVYVFAADYFNMPTLAQRKLIPLVNSGKHYYRFAVTAGQPYTIEWQNGNNQNTAYYFRVSAWQNNGTSIFSDSNNGYSSAKGFTATATGFVTVEVQNRESSGQDYQIYCYGADGNADTGTISLPPYKVSAFRVSSPSQSAISLTWDAVSDGAKYNIYRSNTKNGTPSRIGESSDTSFTDNQVSASTSYWYTIAAVNTDGLEGCRFQGAFGYAASHYTLSIYTSAQTLSLAAGAKHYYRLAVTDGQSYTIEWQNGNNQNTAYYFRVSAWQNNGTSIFSDSNNGYSSPKVFTATATGFVTIEVRNGESNAQNYQIYYY